MSFAGWLVIVFIGLLIVLFTTLKSLKYKKFTLNRDKRLYLVVKEFQYDDVPYEYMFQEIQDEFGLSDEECTQALAAGVVDRIEYFKNLDI